MTFCSLENRTVLLIGAGGGIGRATSVELANAGARLVLVDQLEGPGMKAAQETLAKIESIGAKATFIGCDLMNAESCAKVLTTAGAAGYEIDSVAFIAGVVSTKGLLTGGAEDLLGQVDLHVGSLDRLLKGLVPKWLERGFGTAVVMTSIAGELPAIDKHYYSASKAAATAYVQGLAASYGGRGLRFIPVLANRVGTPSALERAGQSKAHEAEMLSTQLSRQWIKPEEVAATFRFLLSAESRSINGDPFYIADGAKSSLAARPSPIA